MPLRVVQVAFRVSEEEKGVLDKAAFKMRLSQRATLVELARRYLEDTVMVAVDMRAALPASEKLEADS